MTTVAVLGVLLLGILVTLVQITRAVQSIAETTALDRMGCPAPRS